MEIIGGIMLWAVIWHFVLGDKKSKCLKCGGIGKETARSSEGTGFRCESCNSWWKEK
ncbi:MAG: hypothetical protein H8D23_35635 [Candidatus Brocadiales bacterium]|nr:hypothetical protein [Candidatus Brocadiales bacterium]